MARNLPFSPWVWIGLLALALLVFFLPELYCSIFDPELCAP